MKKVEIKGKEKVTESLVEVAYKRFGQENVEKWQKQYLPRKINVIEVEDKIAVLRPICATEIANYSMLVANPEEGLETATRYLFEELWIDGDKEMVDDEEYFISAMLQIEQVINLKKSRGCQL